jgi:hypothetical protein
MGAFYWCSKEFYHKIHGFDTKEGIRFRGHIYWGHLEPMLSLKAKVYGGSCMMYPAVEAGHIFGRIDDVYKVRAVRDDYKYWNALWIAYTMLEDSLRNDLVNFLNPCLNLNLAKSYIRKYWDFVQAVRERNILEGKLISK